MGVPEPFCACLRASWACAPRSVIVRSVILLVFLLEFVLLFIPPEREAALFRGFLPDDIAISRDDDGQVAHARELMYRLSRHLEQSSYEFRLEVDDSPELNAMAFPGGLVVVTRGLLEAVESENELAFVLAHELGHFNNRDHVRRLGRVALFGLVFAAVAGGEQGAGLGLSIAQLADLRFSRGQELRADALGLELVFAEYGHVAEASRFFERIESRETLAGAVFSYGATHPSPGSRIVELLALAGANRWPLEGPVTARP